MEILPPTRSRLSSHRYHLHRPDHPLTFVVPKTPLIILAGRVLPPSYPPVVLLLIPTVSGLRPGLHALTLLTNSLLSGDSELVIMTSQKGVPPRFTSPNSTPIVTPPILQPPPTPRHRPTHTLKGKSEPVFPLIPVIYYLRKPSYYSLGPAESPHYMAYTRNTYIRISGNLASLGRT